MRRIAVCMTIFVIVSCMAFPVFAAGEAVVKIPVSMNAGIVPGDFTITLSQEGVVKDTLVMSGTSTDAFELTFSMPGTYRYSVSQVPGTNPDVEYDSTVYDVLVGVFTDESDKLYAEASVFVQGETTKCPECSFMNLMESEDGDKTPSEDESEKPTLTPDKPSSGTPSANTRSDQNTDVIQTGDEPFWRMVLAIGLSAAVFVAACACVVIRREMRKK